MKAKIKVNFFAFLIILVMLFCIFVPGCTRHYNPYNDENFMEVFELASEIFAGKLSSTADIDGWQYDITTNTKKRYSMKLYLSEYNDVYTPDGIYIRNNIINNQYPAVTFSIEKSVANVVYKKTFQTESSYDIENLLWRDKIIRNSDLTKIVPLNYLKTHSGIETLIREQFNIDDDIIVQLQNTTTIAQLILTFDNPLDENTFLAYLQATPELNIQRVLIKTGEENENIIAQFQTNSTLPQSYYSRLESLYDKDKGALNIILQSELFGISEGVDLKSMINYCRDNPNNILGFICQVSLPIVALENFFELNSVGITKVNLNKFILIK